MKYVLPLAMIVLVGCSPVRQLARELRTNPIYTDHVTGVALYDPVRRKNLIQHHADLPFTPASNTKLISFYAGLLNLPDSLPALRYVVRNDSLIFWGTGNPLLLHPDLPDTSVLAFLRRRPERLFFSPANYTGPRFGPGWAWDDYADDYSAELAPLPIYGNVVRFSPEKTASVPSIRTSPKRFADSVLTTSKAGRTVRRQEFRNEFERPASPISSRQDVPFRWSARLAAHLLADTLHREVELIDQPMPATARLLRGGLADSLYKRMLHVSDNQFAEQILFMTSAERNTGPLDPTAERKNVIDSVLRYPPSAVRWVDGSGLSRYNLFTPNVLIDLLGKIAQRVPQQRLFVLLPGMGQSGTLKSMGTTNKPYVFAKSGSMTSVYNLSGYILTQRGRTLYFSIMHNNFTQPVSDMRRRTADLLRQIHERL